MKKPPERKEDGDTRRLTERTLREHGTLKERSPI